MNDAPKLLVVDDDQMLLDFAVRLLTSLGYSASTATDAPIALRLLKEDPNLKGVIIDMRLGKGASGAELAREALAIRPDLHVLLTSGDPALLQAARQDLPVEVELLPKPYRRHDLAARLSRLL